MTNPAQPNHEPLKPWRGYSHFDHNYRTEMCTPASDPGCPPANCTVYPDGCAIPSAGGGESDADLTTAYMAGSASRLDELRKKDEEIAELRAKVQCGDSLAAVLDRASQHWLRLVPGIPWEGGIDEAMRVAVAEIAELRRQVEESAESTDFWAEKSHDWYIEHNLRLMERDAALADAREARALLREARVTLPKDCPVGPHLCERTDAFLAKAAEGK